MLYCCQNDKDICFYIINPFFNLCCYIKCKYLWQNEKINKYNNKVTLVLLYFSCVVCFAYAVIQTESVSEYVHLHVYIGGVCCLSVPLYIMYFM